MSIDASAEFQRAHEIESEIWTTHRRRRIGSAPTRCIQHNNFERIERQDGADIFCEFSSFKWFRSIGVGGSSQAENRHGLFTEFTILYGKMWVHALIQTYMHYKL